MVIQWPQSIDGTDFASKCGQNLGVQLPLCPLDFTVSLDGTCFVSKSSKSSGAIALDSACPNIYDDATPS